MPVRIMKIELEIKPLGPASVVLDEFSSKYFSFRAELKSSIIDGIKQQSICESSYSPTKEVNRFSGFLEE